MAFLKLRDCAIIALASITIGSLASAARAGECPADKVGVDVTKPGPMKPEGVTDTILSALDLGKQDPAYAGRQLRLRRLVVQPGGIVPWHSHADRPANIYIITGEVTEYRSTCAVPIVHKAGDVSPEFGNISHWWKNTGREAATLISADFFKNGMPDDHM